MSLDCVVLKQSNWRKFWGQNWVYVKHDGREFWTHSFHVDAPLIDGQHWNRHNHLPSPGIPLRLKLKDGSIISGIRPQHVTDRNGGLGYRTKVGPVVVTVVGWQYE